LGVFGFLAHPDAGANFVVLDFLAVLEWIAQNIRAFGGNPDNVTVFWQSSGAQAVRTLLSTRRARGLFHRGIMQSGGFEPSAIAQPWTFARTQATTERLMKMVGAKPHGQPLICVLLNICLLETDSSLDRTRLMN
jgi:para-nitrobenzyl esterase